MRSVINDWLAISRSTWRRDLAVLVLVAFAITATACGGTPAATPKCSTTKQCYAVAGFYQKGTDFAQTPHGVFITIDVAQLTCDTNCLYGEGWISNYALLGTSKLDNWVQIGYSTEYTSNFSSGDPHSFDYYTERALGNTMVTTLYFGEGNPADVGQEANFIVHTVVIAGQTYYAVEYAAPNSIREYVWDPYPASFSPGAAEAGEVLHGGQGEAAEGAAYSGFFYTTSDLTAFPSTPEPASHFPLELKGVGHTTINQPPYAVWIGFNGNPAGWFQTWCC
jgi:hypothetical protein